MSAPPRGDRIGFWVRFVSPEMENRFRDHIRHQELRQIYGSVAGAIFIALAFIPSDQQMVNMVAFENLLTARLAFIAVSCATILLLQRPLKAQLRTWILFGWVLCGAALIGVISSTRPSIFFAGQALVTNFVLMLVYLVVPLILPMQILAALAITATDLWLLFNRHMDIHPVVRRAMVIAYVLTNVIGAYTSRNRNHLSREQFQMLERQIQLNQELEEALEEVRTLRGMLPICSHCRRICNEQGAWEPLDAYVRSHSQADFTHGICPECLKPLMERSD
jgi:hypothetical protein